MTKFEQQTVTRPGRHATAQSEAWGDELTTLLDLLVERGDCERRSADRAQRLALDQGIRPDRALIHLGLMTEQALALAYAALLNLPIAEVKDYPAVQLYPQKLSARFVRRARALPLREDAGAVVVAVADPLDQFVPKAIAVALGCVVKIVVAVPIELEAALSRLYPEQNNTISNEGAPESSEADLERLASVAIDAPVIRLVNAIIARAIETAASDIHFEPFADRLRVRYRYDGVLHETDEPPAHLAAAITSRIKIMAHLDIAERRLPQDGGIRFSNRGTDVDLRVATAPTIYGETVVLRVLDRSKVILEMDRLGLPAPVVAKYRRALGLPNGLVVMTGPTGSGKTTTLYTGMRSLNSGDRKVISVEDPIEYQIPGVNQMQVKPSIGLSFPSFLRAILRHDPDVIMVGEVRDLETAQIAVQAALTGHLVLSTLHTNSAAATIPRLRDMGLETYLLTAVLRGVVAQRLVRKICQLCCREVEPAADLIDRFDLDRRSGGQPLKLRQPVGCTHCRNIGYRGQFAVAEFLSPSPEIDRLIYNGADHTDIERAAVAGGMITMFDAGLDAALRGETTIEEVGRCICTER